MLDQPCFFRLTFFELSYVDFIVVGESVVGDRVVVCCQSNEGGRMRWWIATAPFMGGDPSQA